MPTASGQSVAASWLREQIVRGSPPAIVDVRSRHEFDAGHLPAARHLAFWLAPFHPSASGVAGAVVYCGHGPRARIAQACLRLRGIQVSVLRGHWAGWRRAGFPVEDGPA